MIAAEAESYFAEGMRHKTAPIGERDLAKAATLFRRAADLHHGEACFPDGQMP